MRDYVRMGENRGPTMYLAEDRWGRTISRRVANDYSCPDRGLFERVRKFEAPLDEEGATKHILHGRPVEELVQSVKDQMMVSGKLQTFWEMNVLYRPGNPKPGKRWAGWVREVAIFGSMDFTPDHEFRKREWTWWECFVLLPWLRAWARVLNRLDDLVFNKFRRE